MTSLGDTLACGNAILNASSGILLAIGFLAIKRKKISLHKKMMGSAFVVSILFLVSYLIRYSLTGVHRFPDGGLRLFYLILLSSHTTLAVLTPFLAIRTLFLAMRGRFPEHKKIARITFPIWMYVSVTGVVVYWMLYRL